MAAVIRMQLWNKRTKGVLIVALINGIAGAASARLATLAYRQSGWSITATELVILPVLLLALSPVTLKILRAFYSETSDQSKSTDASK